LGKATWRGDALNALANAAAGIVAAATTARRISCVMIVFMGASVLVLMKRGSVPDPGERQDDQLGLRLGCGCPRGNHRDHKGARTKPAAKNESSQPKMAAEREAPGKLRREKWALQAAFG
jgi:hypothetical protein